MEGVDISRQKSCCLCTKTGDGQDQNSRVGTRLRGVRELLDGLSEGRSHSRGLERRDGGELRDGGVGGSCRDDDVVGRARLQKGCLLEWGFPGLDSVHFVAFAEWQQPKQSAGGGQRC